MTYRAVIFDLDGTLLDTIDDLADAMNASLATLGLPPVTVAQCNYFVGDGVENFARRALPEGYKDDATVAKLLPIYRQAYGRNWANKTVPFPGIAELLDELAARGLKMAVFSNKPDEFTRLMVARLLARWRFEIVQGALPGVPHKPDPQPALDIARRMGVSPGECLYLGDTNTDMQTAVAAGMFAVGALWGFRTADELTANGAKILVARPQDLLTLL